MFSSYICAPLCALVAHAVAASAVPTTVTIVNTSGEALKLLNNPRGVLDLFLEDTFTITDPSGSRPSYSGAMINYNPTDSAGLDDPSSFTVLAPGDSMGDTHDLFAAHSFTQSGAGEYPIEPSNHFTCVNAEGTPKDLYATVEGIAKVELSGLQATVPRRTHNKRTGFYGCTPREERHLRVLAEEAQDLADEAYDYLSSISDSTPRYEKWFGAYNPARKMAIQNVFRRVSQGDQFVDLLYDCVCDPSTPKEWCAYIRREHPGEVWICDKFWKVDEIYKAPILVHELTHFDANGGAKDHGYGPEKCNDMAIHNPTLAMKNADNYLYFVANVERLR